jgi:hypothetical protein
MESVQDGKQSWGFEGDAGLGGLNDHFTAVIDQFNECVYSEATCGPVPSRWLYKVYLAQECDWLRLVN